MKAPEPLNARLVAVHLALRNGAPDLKAHRAEVDRQKDLLTMHTPRGPVFVRLSHLAGIVDRIAPPRPVVVDRPTKAPPAPPPVVGLDAAAMLSAIEQTAPGVDGLVRIVAGSSSYVFNASERSEMLKEARAWLADRKWSAPRTQHTAPRHCIGDFRNKARKDATIEALEHNVAEAERSGNAALIRVMRETLDRARRINPYL